MRCVSSFFLIEFPRLFAASISSPASFSSIDFSPRLREYVRIQRNASDVLRAGPTSTGTWYVEPPTRRDFTSRTGFTFSIAFLKSFSGSSLGFLPFRTFRAVLRTRLFAVRDSRRVQSPTNNVVSNARKVLNAPAANQDD